MEQILKLLLSVCSYSYINQPHSHCSPGGIKSTNLLRTLHGTVSPTNHALDGVAIVSDIVASPEPQIAAETLRAILSQFRQSYHQHPLGFDGSLLAAGPVTSSSIVEAVLFLMKEIRKRNPLVHQVRWICLLLEAMNLMNSELDN
jgi:thiamine-phosphate diphosphorylase/hydroxyethylthiazole kinase